MTRAWYTAVGVAAMVAIACEGQAQGTPGSSPFDGFYGGVFVGNKSTDVRTLTTIDSAFGTTRLPGSTTSESTFFVDRDGEIDREQLVGGLRLGFGRTFGAFHLGGEIEDVEEIK